MSSTAASPNGHHRGELAQDEAVARPKQNRVPQQDPDEAFAQRTDLRFDFGGSAVKVDRRAMLQGGHAGQQLHGRIQRNRGLGTARGR